jgi:hypothetical protein
MSINYVQSNTLYLAGSGVIIGATSITLTTLTDIYGNVLTMSNFGSKGYITLEPDTTNEEAATFTGITANSNGTYTLTGISSVLAVSPYTETSGLVRQHNGGTKVVITDNVAFWNTFVNSNNIATINAVHTFTASPVVPDPVGNTDAANKEWVLTQVNGGPVSTNAVIENGTAGTTIAKGDVVYLNSADAKWYLADATSTSTINNVQLGIAQGAGTSGNAITGGVLRKGLDSNQSGGTAGELGYVKNSGGTVGTSTGTNEKVVGNFITSTTFNFNPDFYYVPSASIKAAEGGSQGVPGSSNTFITQDNLSSAGIDQSQTTEDSATGVGLASTTGLANQLAQSFIAGKTKISEVKLYKTADTGSFTGTVTVSLQADSSGSPSGSNLATITITNAIYEDLSVGEFDAKFSTEYASMTVGSTYWIVISTSTADSSNHPNLGTNSAGGYANGSVKRYNATDNWVAIATIDLYFKTINGVVNQGVKSNSSGYVPLELTTPMSKKVYVYSNTRAGNATTNTIKLNHNLGVIPSYIRVTAYWYIYPDAASLNPVSTGVGVISSDGTSVTYSTAYTQGNTASYIMYLTDTNGGTSATIGNIGSRNLDLTFTKISAGSSNIFGYLVEIFV